MSEMVEPEVCTHPEEKRKVIERYPFLVWSQCEDCGTLFLRHRDHKEKGY